MSVNLLELATTALGSGAIGKIAGSLGESEQQTKSAFEIAGSAILGSLIEKASSPQGAEEVFDQAKKFDTGILDSVGSLLTGGSNSQEESDWSSLGGQLVSGLLGSKETSTIEMLAKLTGIGKGSSKSLLTMLAPLLMGLISKKVKSGDIGLSGLVDLIMGQKSQVAKILPADFSQQLGISGLLDQGADQVRATGSQVSRATRETAASGGGLLKSLVPLAILAAIGFLGWRMLSSDPAKEVAQQTADASTEVIETVEERITANKPAVPTFDLDTITRDLSVSFTDATKSIAGITDQATARDTVPQLNRLQTQFQEYQLADMPEQAKTTLSDLLRPLVEKLQTAIEQAFKIPGVKAILEPATKSLLDSVSSFTKAI